MFTAAIARIIRYGSRRRRDAKWPIVAYVNSSEDDGGFAFLSWSVTHAGTTRSALDVLSELQGIGPLTTIYTEIKLQPYKTFIGVVPDSRSLALVYAMQRRAPEPLPRCDAKSIAPRLRRFYFLPRDTVDVAVLVAASGVG